jgi:glycogen debranching enzyme
LGDEPMAASLDEAAEKLRQNFEAAFWCEELSTYAIALDGLKRPCRVIASNAGHALLAGIAAPDRAARVADTLLRSARFRGGASAPWRCQRRATIRSRITTDRSGRTTMR